MYIHALGNSKVFQLTNLREEEENECFRFGPSQVYVSKKAAILPSNIGKTTKKKKLDPTFHSSFEKTP